MLDNYDSFTYNLYQAVRFLKHDCKVLRNDSLTVKSFWRLSPTESYFPGPGRPEDAGILLNSSRKPQTIPVLGLPSHQAIALANGGPVIRAKRLMHGKTCVITHVGKGLFRGLPKRVTVARYHSLVAAEPLPKNMVVTARAEDGSLMGLRLIDRPVEGVQFHPESVATPLGLKMLSNFLAAARR